MREFHWWRRKLQETEWINKIHHYTLFYIHRKYNRPTIGAKFCYLNLLESVHVAIQEQRTPGFAELTSLMLLDEEIVIWHGFKHFQHFCAHQAIWCNHCALRDALLISSCCIRGLNNTLVISNCCTACYPCSLADASHISSCCITNPLCGLGYAPLLCDFNIY